LWRRNRIPAGTWCVLIKIDFNQEALIVTPIIHGSVQALVMLRLVNFNILQPHLEIET
jgi:hypothetical protein